MSATPAAFASKDNANSTLASGISSSAVTIPLASGQGSRFPQPYNGTCTSLGSATTLNCTGILALIGAGAKDKPILNFTDGSVAFITAVNTNSLTTTALLGGTTNLWNNSDAWRIDEFVLTLVKASDSTAYEEIRVYGRSTDTLNVASTGERGYNSTTAQTFITSDYAYLFVTAPILERLKDIVSILAQKLNTVASSQTTDETSLTNILNASSFYAVDSSVSANSITASFPNITGPIAAGMEFFIKLAVTNTGTTTATLTLGGSAQSAKTIKKNDMATNLVANDAIAGQILHLRYDGTILQLLSPVGTPATITHYNKVVYISGGSSTALTNPTSDTTFDTHSYTVPANDLTATTGYEVECAFTGTIAAGVLELGIMLGGARLVAGKRSQGNQFYLRGFLAGTAAAGASVAVRGSAHLEQNAVDAASEIPGAYAAVNFATNGTLALTLFAKFGTSNGGNNVTCTMAKFTKVSSSAFV